MRKYLLASACVLAGGLFATAALAEGISATGQGTFGNILGFPSWSANGSLDAPIGWEGLSVEGNIGDRGFDSLHQFNVGGSLVWSDPQFRLAGSANYNRFNSNGSVDTTQLGAGGEWYFTDQITASVNGGANVGAIHGGYIGGVGKFYLTPDIAIDGFVEYSDLAKHLAGVANETDYGAHAEWLPLEDIPVSLTGNYTHVHLAGSGIGVSGSADTDTWWLGLKLYLNGSATTLVDRQRTGTLDTIQPVQHFIGTN
jgi:hypothetical protein